MLISNAYLSKRENEKSLEYALKARDYLPEIVSTISKINVLNTIGMQHQQLRIYDKAIEYLDEALALADKTTQKDSINTLLAYNYAIRGFIY
jgi:tetratricopeptide (TPR) repeat protein